MTTKMKALSNIPVRKRRSIDPKWISRVIPRGEEVSIINEKESGKIIYGQLLDGMYVILVNHGINNFKVID